MTTELIGMNKVWMGLPLKIEDKIQSAANEAIEQNSTIPLINFIVEHAKDMNTREEVISQLGNLIAKHTSAHKCGRRDGVMLALFEAYNTMNKAGSNVSIKY